MNRTARYYVPYELSLFNTLSFVPQLVIFRPLTADRYGVSPYVYPLYRTCANVSIIDKNIKVVIFFP